MEPRRELRSIISGPESGTGLLSWIAGRFLYLDTQAWKREIRDGRVTVNDRPANADLLLSTGDVVCFSPEGIREPEVDRDYRLIHSDDDFLVIDKPPNLPCHPGGIYRENTLWTMLIRRYPRPTFVSRLDRETSGLLAAALSDRARRALDPQSRDSEQVKDYLVMVHGAAPERLDADGWISPDPFSKVRKKKRFTDSMPERSRAQSCSTHFIRIAGDGEFSLLRARLNTGRTHQIRATLCSLGFPVVGDKIYGVDEELFIRLAEGRLDEGDRRSLILPHQALHSARLELRFSAGSPLLSGQMRLFHAGLPSAFADLVRTRFALDLSRPEAVRALWDA
jgi:23S rRNA pseudouridine1911/1915/1917 synthase